MATAFTRTLRRMESNRSRRPLVASFITVFVIGVWVTWGALSRVTLYEVSNQARLEVDRAVHSVESPAAGRVIEARMVLGQDVTAGEVLLRLDSDAEQFALREEREKLAAIEPELAALHAQAASIGEARLGEARASDAAAEETRSRQREAEAPAQYAEQDMQRLERLHANGLISERDYQKGRADSQRTRAAAESPKLALGRMAQEQNARDRDRAATLDQIQAQMAHLEGQARTSRVAIMRFASITGRYTVRAPASGRLGELAVLRPGSVIQAGQRIGVIVPAGRLVAIAQFAPSSAIGRIRPGQPARLRLDGFPWAQYGTVEAQVTRVANEINGGRIRVEFAVSPASNRRIALEHGLPGSVEVAVEQAAPLTLLLRTAGAIQAPIAAVGGR